MKTTPFILPALVELVAAIQPSASNPLPNQELRGLEWGQLNFLHTTDNHGWHGGHLQERQYSADFGDYISFVSHMRGIAKAKGGDLIVIDTGDRAEGNGLWDASKPKGKYTRKLYKELDIDFITIGNHELYDNVTALNEYNEMALHYGKKYVLSNVDINVRGVWKPFGEQTYKYVTPNLGLKITSFGFMFNFDKKHITQVKSPREVIKEGWFIKALEDKDVDLFMIIGHISVEDGDLRMVYQAIRKVHPDIPIQIFGGHRHIRKFVKYDDKSTALASGRYFETVGFLSIDGFATKAKKAASSFNFFRRYIDANRVGYQYHTGTNDDSFDTKKGRKMSNDITGYRKELGLDNLIGCAPQDWSLNRDDYTSPNNWYNFLGVEVLPKVVINEGRRNIPRIILVNTGSQRFDVFKGPFTTDTSLIVSPFTSKFRFVPRVPWKHASKLYKRLMDSANPFSHIPEDPQKVSCERGVKSISRVGQGDQHVLSSDNQPTKVPGYTTIDGSDGSDKEGDDTVHSEITCYIIPKMMQAEVFAGGEPGPEEGVDVVFIDFINKDIAGGLNEISGGDLYKAADFGYYMDDTLTELIKKYIGATWGKEC